MSHKTPRSSEFTRSHDRSGPRARARARSLAFVAGLAGADVSFAGCAASVDPSDGALGPDAPQDTVVRPPFDSAAPDTPATDVALTDALGPDTGANCPATRPTEGTPCAAPRVCLYPMIDSCTPVRADCFAPDGGPAGTWRWTPRCVIGPLEPPDLAAA